MLALALLLACGSPEPATPATPAASTGDDVASVLAKADAHDGTVDKVVSECGGCGLGMQGDPAHAARHAGYELHFCAEGCLQRFEADPEAGVQSLASAVD